MMRSVKIQLDLDEIQTESVKLTCLEFNKAYSIAANNCIEQKSSNYYNINKISYYTQKEQCNNLPSAIIQSATKSACGNYKTCKKNIRKYSMERKSMSYLIECLTMTLRGNQLTFSTVNKRVKTIINIPEWFDLRYPEKKLRSGIVKYNNGNISVILQYAIPDIDKRAIGDIVGLDRGMYQIVSTSDGRNYSSKKVRAIKRKMLYNRRCLQKKGTPSAKRKLKRLSGKEQRFVRDINHCISKKLANDSSVQIYVLEDLKDIKNQNKGRILNQRFNGWSYHQLEEFLRYKCEEKGIEIVKVSAKYTSQRCNQCGMINKSNRHKNHYICSCGYHEHADINAAKNIRDRYISQLLKVEQAVFNQPNGLHTAT